MSFVGQTEKMLSGAINSNNVMNYGWIIWAEIQTMLNSRNSKTERDSYCLRGAEGKLKGAW